MSRRAARPLLAVLSIVPLAGIGILAARLPVDPPELASPAAVTAPTSGADLLCPGPVTVPQELLAAPSDPALAVVPPSPTAAVRALALEGDAALLFGGTTASTTRTGDGSASPAPRIEMTAQRAAVGDAASASGAVGDTVVTAPAVSASASVHAEPGGDHGVAVAVSQATLTPAGDFRGLALTHCTVPTTSASFLGMGTAPGTSSALVLRNPSSRPATAELAIATADGPADLGSRSRVVVAPGAEQRILLESLVPGQEALDLRVTTTGAPLAMHVQTTERHGLTPGGAEILTAQPSAASHLVIPGLHAVDGQAAGLVLHNPGASPVTADVSVLGADGAVDAARHDAVQVPAGAVVTVPLAQTGTGDLAVDVTADGPVDGAVRSTVAGDDLPGDTIGAPTDLAIASPAPSLDTAGALALPLADADGVLVLAGDPSTAAAATVIPVGADGAAGAPMRVEIPAGRTASVVASALTGGAGVPAGVVVAPESGPVHATWVQTPSLPGAGGSFASTLTVLPASQGGHGWAVTAG